ncbi:MAG: DUF7010 family protein [Rubrivivax sp.]
MIRSRGFELWLELAAHAGELVTSERLLEAAWPTDAVDLNSLQVQVKAQRRVHSLHAHVPSACIWSCHTPHRVVFPAVPMVIGGRYVTFGTVYGTPMYWLLGASLGAAALFSYVLVLPPHQSALLGAAVEVVFGAVLLAVKRNAA